MRGIHVTYFGTGCIYTYVCFRFPSRAFTRWRVSRRVTGRRCSYDEQYPVGYPVKETDAPNFSGSFYSRTKGVYTSATLHCSGVCVFLSLTAVQAVWTASYPRTPTCCV